MKILVIGKEGQLARSLAEMPRPAAVALETIGRPEIELTERPAIFAAIKRAAPDVVVNTAAYTAVDKAEAEAALAHAVNALGIANIAAACSVVKAKLIHVSTDYVFDGRKAAPYTETDPVCPLGSYGRSKLEGERLVAEACAEHIILRTAWLHSPFGQNFVKTMLRLAGSRAEIGVVDDQTGNPTYAPHAARAIMRIAELAGCRNAAPHLWGTYHLAGSGDATWFAMAREIFRVSGELSGPAAAVRAITTAEYPTPASRPANSRLDCSKLRNAFGIEMPEWRSGVAECVARLVGQSRSKPAER